MTELVPCQFCGSKAVIYQLRIPAMGVSKYAVGCKTNGCRGNVFLAEMLLSQDSAILEWNTRFLHSPAETAVAAMEKAIIEGCEDGRTPIGILHYESDGEQMTESVPITPWEGGTLFDQYGNRVGAYCKETGRGMFSHAFFADERTCMIESAHVEEWHDGDTWETDLSCGHTMPLPPYDFKFCMNCGARVVAE